VLSFTAEHGRIFQRKIKPYTGDWTCPNPIPEVALLHKALSAMKGCLLSPVSTPIDRFMAENR